MSCNPIHHELISLALAIDDQVTWTCPERSSRLVHQGATISPRFQTRQLELTQSPFGSHASPWKGNCFPGQLTLKGFHQHVDLGKQVGEIVNASQLLPDQVYIRSTGFERTQQSAVGFLQGLLAGIKHENSQQEWIIESLDTSVEYMFPNFKQCPRLDELMNDSDNKVHNTTEWGAHLEREMELQHSLDPFMDPYHRLPAKGRARTRVFFDSLSSRICNDIPLPCHQNATSSMMQQQCMTQGQVDDLIQNSYWENDYLNRKSPLAKETIRLNIGQFIGDLVSILQTPTDAKKLYIFSGHDVTISSLIGSLLQITGDEFATPWPAYASNLMLQVWKLENGQFVVRALYDGNIVHWNVCPDSICPVQDLIQHWEPYIPTDLVQECISKLV
jgi:Histidine phosphatase superfamily (branch 2)